MSKSWITPEEMYRKRRRNKILFNISIPLVAVVIGTLVTLLLS